jgi:cytochrome c biogenesis protein CcmG, thiol:disulfide interchange protein DsbE
MSKTQPSETTPLGFEVEIESGGRAHDLDAPASPAPTVLSPARAAAKARDRRRNAFLAIGTVAVLLGLIAWMWFTNPNANVPSDAVARVNGEFIYQRDVDKRLDFTRWLNELSSLPVTEQPSASSKLEEIIAERMQIQDAHKAGVTVTDQELEGELGQVSVSTGRTMDEIRQSLEKYNLGYDDLRTFVSNAVLVRKYKDQYVLAGAKDVQDAQNRENDWLTSLAQTSRIDRFKSAGSGPAPRVGAEAPDFTLKDLDGKEVKLSTLRGKPVMVNFWATWCPPCRAEIPIISQTYIDSRKDGSVPYEILGVATQSDTSTIRAFAGEFNMTFPLLPDVDNHVVSSYHVLPIPTTFFIDKEGIIRYIQTGPVTPDLMQKWLLDN